MGSDDRPGVWVGHVVLGAADVAESVAFYVQLGMREVEVAENASVLELRGGTHLVIIKGEPAPQASFDLMVEDLEATHDEGVRRGLEVSEIQQVPFHQMFTVIDPSGTAVTVNSSHVVGNV